MSFTTPRVIIATMLILAPLRLAHGYYPILRWVVSLVCCYGVLYCIARRRTGWAILYAASLVIFNPLLPLRMPRVAWAPLDLVVALVILLSIPGLSVYRLIAARATTESVPPADGFTTFAYRMRAKVAYHYGQTRRAGRSRLSAVLILGASYLCMGYIAVAIFGSQVAYFLGVPSGRSAVNAFMYFFVVTLVSVTVLLTWSRREFW